MNKLYIAAFLIAGASALGTSEASSHEACVRIVGFDWNASNKIDPSQINYHSESMLVYASYEQLVEVDREFAIHPWLAESWESNADATQWTFKLRKGVKFHDGSDFDASDVVYTYRRLIDPAQPTSASSLLSFLSADKIEAVDSHTVRFTVEKPMSELPLLLVNKFAHIIPDGAKPEVLSARSLGTGPFVIREDFRPNAPRVVLQSNPGYWMEGKPAAACLDMIGVSEPVSRTSVILSGEADLIIAADATTLLTLKNDPSIRLLEAPGATVMTLSMMIDVPPFNDKRVREALKLLVDREALVQSALLGFGIVGNDSPVPPTSPAAWTSEPLKRDVEKAKALLSEAGYADGLKLELYTGATDLYPGTTILAQMFREMAAEAGVQVEIMTSPADSFWDEVWRKKPFITSYAFGRAPAEAFALLYKADTPFNETHWFRPDFDALLEKAAATTDGRKRIAIFQEAGRLLAEEGGVIAPMLASVVTAIRQNCSGYVPHIELNRMNFRDLKCER